MSGPTLVLAAHGTRDPAGARAVRDLARRVRAALPGVVVRVAYADVRGPAVDVVLAAVAPEPAVVVPVFLASGYHVRLDLPAQLAASGHPAAVLTPALGPAPPLAAAAADHLRAAGYRPGDAVVLAAAGSSDPRALAEVERAAALLAARLDAAVRVGYAATASLSVADAVRAARAGSGRVAVASWLLAPGLFQRRVARSGADVVAAPLSAHRGVVDVVLARYNAAALAPAR